MDNVTLDGVKAPVVGYTLWGFDGAGVPIMRRFDAEEYGYAQELAQAIEDEGGQTMVTTVVDFDPIARSMGYTDTRALTDDILANLAEES